MTQKADQADDVALTKGWQRVAWLVGLLLALPGIAAGLEQVCHRYATGPLPDPVRREALRLVQAAEALVRRLLAVMAFQLPLPRHPGRPQGDPGPSIRGGAMGPGLLRVRDDDEISGIKPRTPSFRLFEYVPSLDWSTEEPPVRPLFPPLPKPPRPLPSRPLLRRVAALHGVLKHRDRAARRLARWLEKSSRSHRPRLHNLRPGPPPGLGGDDADAGRAAELAERVRSLARARAGPDMFTPKTIHDARPRKRGPDLVRVRIRPGLVWR